MSILRLLPYLLVASAGCAEQQMARQPAPRTFQASRFFPDDMSARPLVQGTVARGHLKYDLPGYNGMNPKYNPATQAAGMVGLAVGSPLAALALDQAQSPFVNIFPFLVTEKVLKRGKERFEIYCYVCHGYTGEGNGMVAQRGFTKPPSYHEPRLQAAPVGHFYNVMTKGYGAMPSHDYLVEPEDRWAIAAYIRALQLSQNAKVKNLPEALQKQLQEKGAPQ